MNAKPSNTQTDLKHIICFQTKQNGPSVKVTFKSLTLLRKRYEVAYIHRHAHLNVHALQERKNAEKARD